MAVAVVGTACVTRGNMLVLAQGSITEAKTLLLAESDRTPESPQTGTGYVAAPIAQSIGAESRPASSSFRKPPPSTAVATPREFTDARHSGGFRSAAKWSLSHLAVVAFFGARDSHTGGLLVSTAKPNPRIVPACCSRSVLSRREHGGRPLGHRLDLTARVSE